MPGDAPLQFNYIPYPLWRRRLPLPRALTDPLFRRVYPVAEDRRPPESSAKMAAYLARYDLLATRDTGTIAAALDASIAAGSALNPDGAQLVDMDMLAPPPTGTGKIRVPAQWEPVEAVLLNWPVLYPPLWSLYAQMVAAIVPVAYAAVTVPAPVWAHAAWTYLDQQSPLTREQLTRVRFLPIPTDDIWVRDYGPVVGLNGTGEQSALSMIYDHHPDYPQSRDNAMPGIWAGHSEIPLQAIRLHNEGGNFLSDGMGTLVMSERVLQRNPYLTRQTLEDYLHSVIEYDKLIITPRLPGENTGHVDLLVKLAEPETVMTLKPSRLYGGRMRQTKALFKDATNARGRRYRVVELPSPRPYLNWFVYPIFRSYTNSLTVNGRVLVPVYGIASDDEALRTYEDTLPDYDIIPIDMRVGINGGGAVHCMTKEIPAGR